jgi:hypothetical protein
MVITDKGFDMNGWIGWSDLELTICYNIFELKQKKEKKKRSEDTYLMNW